MTAREKSTTWTGKTSNANKGIAWAPSDCYGTLQKTAGIIGTDAALSGNEIVL